MHDKNHRMGKRPYSIPEIQQIAVKAFRSMGRLARGKRTGKLSDRFQERIMLAVTGVNRCAMCSYAHTELALRAGISEQEIREIAAGEFPNLPQDEIRAVLFAQHYADRRGKPSRDAWEEIQRQYGPEMAGYILAAIQVIMLGNSVGIVLSSVKERLHGRKGDPRTGVPYEITVLVLLIPVMLLSLLQALLMSLLGLPNIRFS